MKLLNEMFDDWDITELVNEMDTVLEQYKNLIKFTKLNEGVLDNLGDELVQQVTEIQRRIDVIERARNIVKKLEQSGGFSKEKAQEHRKRLKDNRKSLRAALQRTQKKMNQFQKTAKQELKKAAKVEDSEISIPQSDVDLRIYGLQAPFLLRQASENGIDFDRINYEKYSDTFESLVADNLVTKQGKITRKGQDALDAHRAKRKTSSIPPQRTRSPIDDLADMDDDNRLRDLNFS